MTKIIVFPAPIGRRQLFLTYTHAYLLDANIPNMIVFQAKRVPEESWQFWYTRIGGDYIRVYKDHVSIDHISYAFPDCPDKTLCYPLAQLSEPWTMFVMFCATCLLCFFLGTGGIEIRGRKIWTLKPSTDPVIPGIVFNFEGFRDSRVLWTGYTITIMDTGTTMMFGNATCALWASKERMYIRNATHIVGQFVGQGLYHLDMQTDGNLVLYNTEEKPIWSTGSKGTTAVGVHLNAACTELELIRPHGESIPISFAIYEPTKFSAPITVSNEEIL